MGWLRKRPLIGVTCPSRSSIPAWFFIRWQIWMAGGRAIRITPKDPLPHKQVSGLILGGGADIDPVRYKEKVIPTIKQESHQVRHKNKHFVIGVLVWLSRKLFSLEFTTQLEDKERDELEFQIVEKAVQKKLPILGICRGAQLLNVYFGGSLHQDIADFYTEQPHLHSVLPLSTVIIDPQSRLHSILHKKYTKVNSLHHQSVKTVGLNLKAVAHETNGLIEAIEHLELPFVIGVQWHPEFMVTDRRQRRIFQSLVQEASKAEPLALVSVSEVPVSA